MDEGSPTSEHLAIAPTADDESVDPLVAPWTTVVLLGFVAGLVHDWTPDGRLSPGSLSGGAGRCGGTMPHFVRS